MLNGGTLGGKSSNGLAQKTQSAVLPQFPFIGRWEVSARNSWSSSRKDLKFSGCGISFELAFASAGGSASWSSSSYIRISVGGAAAALGIPQDLAEAVLESFGVRHEHLSGETTLLLIEHRFSAALDSLEGTIGEPIETVGFSSRNPFEGTPHVRLDASLRFWKHDYRLVFFLTPHSAPKLTACLDRAALRLYRKHDATGTATFCLGSTRLTLAKLKTIELNDVILADRAAGKGLTTVLVGGAYKASASYGTGKAVLLEPLSRTASHERKWGTMSSGSTERHAPDAGLDDLEINIVFEIGRLELRLEELDALGTGHVFDLGRDARTAVDIYAGSRRIGFGEIVEINDTLGVRVTRLFNNE